MLRVLLWLAVLLVSAPLCANSVTFAKPREARQTMQVLLELVRDRYAANGNKLNAGWKLEDIAKPEAIQGTFVSERDFAVSFPTEDTVRIECANAYPLRQGPLVLSANLRTGAETWEEPPVDERRELWLNVAVVLATLIWCAGPVLFIAFFTRRTAMPKIDRVSSAVALSGWWVGFFGVVFSIQVMLADRWVEDAPLAMSRVFIIGTVLGLCVGTVSAQFVQPRWKTGMAFHALSALIGGLLTGLVAIVLIPSGIAAAVAAFPGTLVLAASSVSRWYRLRAPATAAP